MIKRERYKAEFENITLHCFDIMKYRNPVDYLNFSVWVNFRDDTYYSGDILVEPSGFCTWTGKKWVLKKNSELIKQRGIQQILDDLEINYKDKDDGKLR